MARKDGASSKMIHKWLRNEIDVQLICDSKQEQSPLHWVKRLEEIFERANYILQVPKNCDFKPSDIGKLVSSQLEPLATDITICKPGPRVNINLQKEMDDFFIYGMEYYSKQIETKKENELQKVQGDITYIIDLINAAIVRGKEEPLTRAFFYHSNKKRRFCRFNDLVNYDGQVDQKLMIDIKVSFGNVWEAMLPKFFEMQRIFSLNSVFKYKPGKTYQDKELNDWLHDGINKFFDPLNAKITNDETKVRLLKMLIINKDVKK
jgi:hypothetical protein